MRSRIDAVVVGTSAGGIEALSVLLPALPANTAWPLLVVIHLTRERPSLLVELFQPKCAVTVREAQDKDPLEAGTVFSSPHPTIISSSTRGLSWRCPQTSSYIFPDRPLTSCSSRPPRCTGERLLGIILSGASEDGAAGLEAVHRSGGWTIVQDPATAQSPVMAEAAIRRSPVDFVMSLDEIARVLGTVSVGESL